MEKKQNKKVYLVDSENVGDLWVTHLMKLAEPEDDIVVFYTPKSPHMGYEHIRMLLNSSHEVEFMKCVEGQNALDFQLVTELGYRLGSVKEDIEYIIVTNDTGFDAVVKYWQNREMPVKRYNAKYCYNLVNQKEMAKKALEENVQEENKKANVSVTIQLLQGLQEEPKERKTESAGLSKKDMAQHEKTENLKEDVQEVEGVVEPIVNGKKIKAFVEENKINSVEIDLAKESNEEAVLKVTKQQDKKEIVTKKKEKLTEKKKSEKSNDKEQHDLVVETKENITDQDAGETLVRDLVSCIGTKNIPDIHNALICLLGSQKGKEVYKQVKRKLNDYVPANKMQIKNRFKTYCQIVFEHSEQKEECPKDFSKFVYDAKDKRKNLNSFRSALQNEYGKEKGMNYYTIMKPHVKILNRMQNA